MIICPRCDGQGEVRQWRIRSSGQRVFVCEECDATWLSMDEIGRQPWLDFFTLLEEQGIPTTHDAYIKLPEIPFDPFDPTLLTAAIVNLERTMTDESGDVRPGAREGLAAMRARGWPIACVSERPHGEAVRQLEARGLMTLFTHVFGAESFDPGQNAKKPYRKACVAMDSTPFRTVVLGASFDDWREARVGACAVVLVGDVAPDLAVRADSVVARLDDLFV
jgi:phosphoglycolate phosphatase-like HAD superfamily hydrolase